MTFEQVPASYWSWPINEAVFKQWNQYFDIFRTVPTDGTVSLYNSKNEIVGFYDDESLSRVYRAHWDGLAGITITLYGPDPNVIIETDLVFNSDRFWAASVTDWLAGRGNFYRPIFVHELGHACGLLHSVVCGEETYLFDCPTVMQSGGAIVVEDGHGLHCVDVLTLRRMFKEKVPILPIVDLGVESYYAEGKLYNATTDKVTYVPGDSLVIDRLTVENMSNDSVSDVDVTIWLSSDTEITEADYLVSGGKSWGTFPGEAFWSGGVAGTVPVMPAGYYRVGLVVSTSARAFGTDDLSENNRTFLYQQIYINPPPPPPYTPPAVPETSVGSGADSGAPYTPPAVPETSVGSGADSGAAPLCGPAIPMTSVCILLTLAIMRWVQRHE